MPKAVATFDLAAVVLDSRLPISLSDQLAQALRDAIVQQRLRPGSRLPSSRSLSASLVVGRITVLNAYEQLIAEGYLESRVGSGTFVRVALPDELLPASGGRSVMPQQARRARLSSYGLALLESPLVLPISEERPQAFRPNLPDLEAFPLELWGRLVSRCLRHATIDLLRYGDPRGYEPLRAAIAGYLGMFRGVHCTAEQVIITSGSQQAIDLASRMFLNPGDAVWIEEPGYADAQALLQASGMRLISLPVDRDGLVVAEGVRRCPEARLSYVTPAHQMPLGVTLSPARRLELLAWAQQHEAWILEDDYDGEYRYQGRPIAALQSLDTTGRVIYIGTCSKTMFPALRIGYLVVPPALADLFAQAKTLADRQAATIEQVVMADFIREGHLARHIRRMRLRYAERCQILADALQSACGDILEVDDAAAGLHMVAWLPEGASDRAVARALARAGIEVRTVSDYALLPGGRGGLVLGYAAFNEQDIQAGVVRLAGVLRDTLGK